MPDRVVARRRRRALHARRHRERPPGLAVDRRHAARLDLGPRRLRRARLERGLAASRSDRGARRLGATRSRARALRGARRRAARRVARTARDARCATNTYDAATGTITLDADRAAAIANVAAHYESLFGNDPATAALREAYAMNDDTVRTPKHRRALTAFFWWTAWAASDRIGRSADDHLHQQLAERAAGRQPAAGEHVPVVGLQRAVPDRRHRAARLAPRRHARRARRTHPPAGDRPARDGARHAVDARDREVLLGRARAVPGADPARRDHGALPGRRAGALRLRSSPRSCRIRSRGPGTRSSRCCGSRRPGSAPASTSRPRCRATSRSSSASASTSCGSACSSSWSDRSPASGSP